jgi:hypothetical protein
MLRPQQLDQLKQVRGSEHCHAQLSVLVCVSSYCVCVCVLCNVSSAAHMYTHTCFWEIF